jgi:magnesium chelatase family protein
VLAKTASVALVGTEARLVDVEVQTGSTGVPGFSIVGLPTTSVREAAQRVRSALESTSDLRWPASRRMVANLAPAGLRKEGTHFDLPIALGVLKVDEQLDTHASEWVVVGELALDGSIRPVNGVLAAGMACREAKQRGVICPSVNAPEAALVRGIEVVAVSTIRECVDFLHGTWAPPPVRAPEEPTAAAVEDMDEVRGQGAAKRAAEIAAAGGHNLLLIGPPGSGKTMLARRVPGILPGMGFEESLEVTRIYSVAGLLRERGALITTRPFRSPHHHISNAGLIGGGSGVARPGEVSLAHRGVLFLDELGLYRRDVLESLRAPVEEGVVRIARSGGVISYPCRFALVAAMNPCQCGFHGDSRKPCRCSERQLQLYRARISGPLLDRFDIQADMARMSRHELLATVRTESSAEIRARVDGAHKRQTARYGSPSTTNASATKSQLEAAVVMTESARAILGSAIDTLALSGRGLDRVRRLALTIADLDRTDTVSDEHVAEALSYRSLEAGSGWAA